MKKEGQALLEKKDIIAVWGFIIRNIPIIIMSSLIVYVIGFIYIYRIPNVYGAKSELLLKSNETYDYQDPIYQGLGAYGMYMDVQNQMRILKSYDLVGEVIDKIGIKTSYFIVGRLKKQEVFETLPFKVDSEIFNSKLYENPIKVKILDENIFELVYDIGDEQTIIRGVFDEELITTDFKLRLSRRYAYLEGRLESIIKPEYEVIVHSRSNLINKFRSAMAVQNLEYTSIVQVNVRDELQVRAKMFLDTLTHTYLSYTERIQLEVNYRTTENIEKQIDTVRAFILEKEIELIEYKNNRSILNLPKEEEDYFIKYIGFTKDVRFLSAQKASVMELKNYLKDDSENQLLPPSFLIESTDLYLQQRVEEIRSKETELEIMKTNLKEDNPNFQILKIEIALLKRKVRDYLTNVDSGIDLQIETAQNYVDEYARDIQRLPGSAQGIQNIQRELNVNNNMYVFLLEKKTNTLIARAGVIPQVRIIQNTIGTGIVYPDKPKIKLMWLVGGILLGFFIALIRTFLFDKIENVDDLSLVTSLSVVGGIPLVKNKIERFVIESSPKSQVAESFRTIRTNLSFMGDAATAGKVVMLSSFFPGEGKTFCSTNLSYLLAKTEKKVLIVDFDMHKPRVHKVFSLTNEKGLSTYSIGTNSFEEVINKDVEKGLDVITAGPIAPNPSELIFNEAIEKLFTLAREKYDVVIIDTPPFGLLNDTFDIEKYVDIFLIVLNTSQATRSGVKQIEKLTDLSNKASKGILLNGIKQTKFQYYYAKYTYRYGASYSYGYRYGSGYGEGYGNDELN